MPWNAHFGIDVFVSEIMILIKTFGHCITRMYKMQFEDLILIGCITL